MQMARRALQATTDNKLDLHGVRATIPWQYPANAEHGLPKATPSPIPISQHRIQNPTASHMANLLRAATVP
jgi:hypothetical protein